MSHIKLNCECNRTGFRSVPLVGLNAELAGVCLCLFNVCPDVFLMVPTSNSIEKLSNGAEAQTINAVRFDDLS